MKSGLAGPRHVARAMATVRRVVRLQPGDVRAAIDERTENYAAVPTAGARASADDAPS